jgi:hypothetical protein
MNSFAFASEAKLPRPDESMAFLAFSGKRTPASISQSAEGALQNVSTLIEQLLVQTVSARTREEFNASREEVFPKYADFLMAYANIVRGSLTTRAVKQLNYESLLDLEAHLRNSGMEAFGEQLKDQAIFATWTLRQINEIVAKFAERSLSNELEAEDRELANNFRVAAFSARFSLDCLIIAMTRGIAVFPGVLSGISDGLRGIVNAYSYVRQGHCLRKPEDEAVVVPIDWDDEDELLLRAAE